MCKAIIREAGEETQRAFEAGALLSAVLNSGGHSIDLPCGGAGTCRRCRVQARGALSPPTKAEEAAFTKAELDAGHRLACQTKALGDVEIWRLGEEGIAQILNDAAPDGPGADPLYARYGLAVDIGTTTVAARLFSREGASVAASVKNPQTRFGADVITRIGCALEGQGEALAAAVRGGVAGLLETLAGRLGIAPRQVDAMVLTGNTAMLYLLNGDNPDALSHTPFEADHLYGVWRRAGDYFPQAGEDARLFLPRCISAFVGADITTAILSSGLCRWEDTALLIDIGTNGEMALWHEGKLHCCATAAGPAFEGIGMECGVYAVEGAIDKVWVEDGRLCHSTIGGRQAVGICGSGIIDTLAVLLQAGVVDETGAFQTEGHPFEDRVVEHKGQDALRVTDGVVFTAEDVRKVQLAKGAIRAGAETLIHHAGITAGQVAQLYIAGGFGNYLDLHSAVAIGLIPEALEAKAAPIGNAALAGAVQLLQDKARIAESEALARSATTIDLGTNETFKAAYMEYMMFE